MMGLLPQIWKDEDLPIGSTVMVLHHRWVVEQDTSTSSFTPRIVTTEVSSTTERRGLKFGDNDWPSFGRFSESAGTSLTQPVLLIHRQLVRDWLSDYPWVFEAMILERKGHNAQALRKVYSKLRGDFNASRFDVVDKLLHDAQVGDLSKDILLGLLTATLEYHSFLPSRPEFFKRVKEKFERQGISRPGLLSGLG